MYKITMTRTTSGEVVVDKEITGFTRAYTTYVEMCEEHSYEFQENVMEGGYIAGGHGFDYIIELQDFDPDDNDNETI